MDVRDHMANGWAWFCFLMVTLLVFGRFVFPALAGAFVAILDTLGGLAR